MTISSWRQRLRATAVFQARPPSKSPLVPSHLFSWSLEGSTIQLEYGQQLIGGESSQIVHRFKLMIFFPDTPIIIQVSRIPIISSYYPHDFSIVSPENLPSWTGALCLFFRVFFQDWSSDAMLIMGSKGFWDSFDEQQLRHFDTSRRPRPWGDDGS